MPRPRVPMMLWRVPRWDDDGPARLPLILLYHSVANVASDPWGLRVSPRNFAEQMAVLRRYAHPISLQELADTVQERGAAALFHERSVVVTFDDGYWDNLQHAKPLLVRNQIPATVFVASGYVGSDQEYWWDELDRILLQPGRLPENLLLNVGGHVHEWHLHEDSVLTTFAVRRLRRWRAWQTPAPTRRHEVYRAVWELLRKLETPLRERALEQLRAWAGLNRVGRLSHRCVDLEQLSELASGNLIEVGAHTVTHPSLGAIDMASQRREIFESKRWLEDALRKPVTSFSYPFGSETDYTQQTVELCRQAGFSRACANVPGAIKPGVDRFQYPRQVVQDWDGWEFVKKLQKWMRE